MRLLSSVTFLRSVFLLKLCSKECLGFGGEIVKCENMNNQLRRKGKEGGLATGMTLQTDSLLQSRELKIAVEKQAIEELRNNSGKILFIEMKTVKDKT